MSLSPQDAFDVLPKTLAAELTNEFNKIVTAYAERRWEQSELDAGRLCEITYTVTVGYLDGGTYPDRASKPNRFPDACWGLANKYPTHPSHSARILIPRMMMGLYDIRNNRGVGHAGGDVDSNEMDATASLYLSKWLMAELVRLLHGLDLNEAQEIVDVIVEREIPAVWINGDKRRVLRTDLSWKDKIVLLLINDAEVAESELFRWSEHGTIGNFRTLLRKMHKSAIIDYDGATRVVRLLPPGVMEAEAVIERIRTKSAHSKAASPVRQN